MAERPVGKRRPTDGSGGEVEPDEPDARDGFGEDRQGEDGFGNADPHDHPATGDVHTALPSGVDSWRKRSATGAILTGFALGLQQVFEPERREPAIVQETSGEPPTDLPVEAELEGIVGRRSVVRIRPWLLDQDMAGAEPGVDAGPSSTTTGIAPRARRARRLRRRRR
ncbi:MAG: hypothetical protein M3137_11985 [Actinomycetota bacterium]|nr:hypothetical protein [Actinomycetota bacterium]